MSSEFTQIGIYEKGDVITVGNAQEAFLDCTFDFALIRKINGGYIGKLYCEAKVYDSSCVDFEICNISKLDTWKKIIETGLLNDVEWYDDNPLIYVLTSEFKIDNEVFDYLYSIYPETDLETVLYSIKRYNAAVWAHEHGANPHYKNSHYYMKDFLNWNRYTDSAKIYEYLYNEKLEQNR